MDEVVVWLAEAHSRVGPVRRTGLDREAIERDPVWSDPNVIGKPMFTRLTKPAVSTLADRVTLEVVQSKDDSYDHPEDWDWTSILGQAMRLGIGETVRVVKADDTESIVLSDEEASAMKAAHRYLSKAGIRDAGETVRVFAGIMARAGIVVK